jgi:hypothetical protein
MAWPAGSPRHAGECRAPMAGCPERAQQRAQHEPARQAHVAPTAWPPERHTACAAGGVAEQVRRQPGAEAQRYAPTPARCGGGRHARSDQRRPRMREGPFAVRAGDRMSERARHVVDVERHRADQRPDHEGRVARRAQPSGQQCRGGHVRQLVQRAADGQRRRAVVHHEIGQHDIAERSRQPPVGGPVSRLGHAVTRNTWPPPVPARRTARGWAGR